MERSFQFSAPVLGGFALVAVLATAVALLAPSTAVPIGIAGALAAAAKWFKVAFRTKKWLWWEFGTVPLTQVEGVVGISGALLFAAMLLAGIAGMGNAT